MRTILCLVLAVLTSVAVAGRDSFSCEVKSAMVLADNGAVTRASGFLALAVGKTFAINRRSGVVLGEFLGNSRALEKRIVADGTAQNAYILFSINGPEADYIYVDAAIKAEKKPFLALTQGKVVLSGFCN